MEKPIRKKICGRFCGVCRSWIGSHQDERPPLACNECGYPACRICYEFMWKVGNQLCPTCSNIKRHTGFPAIVSDELQCTADSWEHNSKHIVDSSNLESPLSSKDLYTAANYRREQDNDISHYPNKTIVPLDVPQTRTIWKALKAYTGLPSHFIKRRTLSYPSFGIWGLRTNYFLPSPVPCYSAIQKVHLQASDLTSFNTPFWKERLQQWKLSQ